MRLGRRLAIAFTTVTAAVVAASFVSIFLLVRRDELGDLDRALSSQARTAAHVIDEEGARELDGFTEVPEDLDPLPRFVALYDKAGGLEASSKSFEGNVPELASLRNPSERESQAVEIEVGGQTLRGVFLPISGQRTLLYAVSRREVDNDERFLLEMLTCLFAVVLGATAGVGLFLGKRLARDVEGLATVARAVSGGDLAARAGHRAWGSSELRSLASDLDMMIERLGALVVAQRTFVSHAAHELRSPLATLRGEVQLALRRSRTAEEYKSTLTDLLEEVEGLVRLAEDLLTLARVQGGEPGNATTSLRDMVAEALRMSKGRALERSIVIDVDTPSPDPKVRGGRGELSRALRNLVDNAITHSEVGSHVTISAERSDRRIELRVTDEGCGIPDSERDRIFSPFFRGTLTSAGLEPGAGLGLAIARGIVRAQGGELMLGEQQEKGTTFVVVLVEPETSPSLESSPPLDDEPASYGGQRRAS